MQQLGLFEEPHNSTQAIPAGQLLTAYYRRGFGLVIRWIDETRVEVTYDMEGELKTQVESTTCLPWLRRIGGIIATISVVEADPLIGAEKPARFVFVPLQALPPTSKLPIDTPARVYP